MGKKKSNRKHLQKLEECSRGYDGSYEVMDELLNDKRFVKAARESTTPTGFKRYSPKLIEISDRYETHRISLSAADGRTYFDSALPVANHNGTYVKDINGNNINVSGSPDVLYSNLIAYDVIYERKSKGKRGVGGDVIWDETVGANQYFLTKTVIPSGKHQCDKHKFILRVSNKPELLLGPGILPIKAQKFAVVDDKPFVVVNDNIFPIEPEKIAVRGGQRFVVIGGQTIALPD